MKLGVKGWAAAIVLVCTVAAAPKDGATDKTADKKDKPKAAAQAVDSGTFGVFVKGQRVLTETFSIQQENGNSIIQSRLKEAGGASPVDQKSDLEIGANSGLIRYEWSQGGGGSLVVLPKDEFLIEKITTSALAKPAEQPFLMPNTSMILDNNFFVQREVLAWRYLNGVCKPEGGGQKCQKEPAEFGALVPQDRTSIRVRMELVGNEKVSFRGADRQLLRLNLKGEGFEWSLWLDDQDQFKLMRISIPADNTEVVRD